MQFLLSRRLRVPEDVSLICTDGDPHFAWCRPPIAHIRWDTRPVVRRAVRWAANIARGKRDVRQTLTKPSSSRAARSGQRRKGGDRWQHHPSVPASIRHEKFTPMNSFVGEGAIGQLRITDGRGLSDKAVESYIIDVWLDVIDLVVSQNSDDARGVEAEGGGRR